MNSPSAIMEPPEFDHVRILEVRLADIRPSPENDALYHPVSGDDPQIQALAESLRLHGQKEPLVLTLDNFILSGHRRHQAARLLRWKTLRCRFEGVRRSELCADEYLTLLREFNRQRVKSLDEALREELVSANPEQAYQSLIDHRRKSAEHEADDRIELRKEKRRAAISQAKQPMLDAIRRIIEERRAFWPLSDRQVHYALLNAPPLRHASKPDSVYRNDLASYKSLTELLTRARLAGFVSWSAIHDETRPVTTWQVDADPSLFLRRELDEFLKGYWRDLMRSQPNHIEIVGEKNTIQGIIRPVAMRFCIPLTIGRGYCSLDPRRRLAQRFEKSGKERLVLLILSDFDPDGQEIAHSFARSLRDDFGVENVDAIKVALTAGQVVEMNLPPILEAKEKSANYNRFVGEHGTSVFELEAVPPEKLQEILTSAVDRVIHAERFNSELESEKTDAVFLEGVRRQVHRFLSELPSMNGGQRP
jgi:ParB-like chromosome segregation protein Spo0J